MQRYAGYIEDRAELFKTLVEAIYTNVGGNIGHITVTTDTDREVVTHFRDVILSTQEETRGAIASNVGYSASVRVTENQDASRVMRTSSKRLADGIDAVVAVLRQHERRSGELARMLDRKLNP